MGQIITENGIQYEVIEDFYVYTANFGAIAGSATATVNINVESDSSFVAQKLTFSANSATYGVADDKNQTNITRPAMTISITDTGSGRQLMNTPMPVHAVCGSGDLPHILSTPKEFRANSTIQVSLTDFGNVGYSNVFVSLIGKKLFKIARG